MSVAAVIVAAGKGTRFGAAQPKQFVPLAGKPLLFHSIEIFEDMAEVERIVLVVPGEWAADFGTRFDLSAYGKIARWVAGGRRRQDSVRAGLSQLPPDAELVAIHDAVRPLASRQSIRKAIERARAMGAAILAAPAVDTPKRCDGDRRIIETLDRDRLWLAQTPQVFRCDLIRRAYEKVFADGVEVTDDAAAVERLGAPVEVVGSAEPNPKITTQADLQYAEWLLSRRDRRT